MGEKTKGQRIVGGVNQVEQIIETLVPTVAAIGGMVRLMATAFHPTDAQKAEEFADAIAKYDAAKPRLDAAIDGFEAAKAEASARAAGSVPAVDIANRSSDLGDGHATHGHGSGDNLKP